MNKEYFKQEEIMECDSDIVVIGGSAGCGKTYLLHRLAEKFLKIDSSYNVIFRRSPLQTKGTLHHLSLDYFKNNLKPHYNKQRREFTNKKANNSSVKFRSMQYDKSTYDHAGLQYTMIGFDEATQFTTFQIRYMMSRLRSQCEHKSQMYLTCNPEKESFVCDLIKPYLEKSGYPKQEMAGAKMYFYIDSDEVIHHSFSKIALMEKFDGWREPISISYFPLTIYDNPCLIEDNPKYLETLKGLRFEEREKLLNGRWK